MVRSEGTVADEPIAVLGVDPADGRALAELPRWVPAEATVLLRVPSAEGWPPAERSALANPPGALLELGRRLRGDRPAPAGVSTATAAAAEECGVPASALEFPGSPAVPRSHLWSMGAWTVTVASLVAPIAGIVAFVLEGGLLAGLLAILLVVAAIALSVGFGYAHEAAAIRRADASIAAAIAAANATGDELAATPSDAGDGASGERSSDAVDGTPGGRPLGVGEERPVVVLPDRHAAGVAAALRERGIEAESSEVGEDPDPPAAA